MDAPTEIERLLKADGANLIRQNKHKIYNLSNGKTYIRSSTPDNPWADLMELARLKRALGLQDYEFREGERRDRKPKAKKADAGKLTGYSKFNNSLAAQLQLVGATEASLREQITELEIRESQLEYALELTEDALQTRLDELAEYEAIVLALELKPCCCLWCRVKALF